MARPFNSINLSFSSLGRSADKPLTFALLQHSTFFCRQPLVLGGRPIRFRLGFQVWLVIRGSIHRHGVRRLCVLIRCRVSLPFPSLVSADAASHAGPHTSAAFFTFRVYDKNGRSIIVFQKSGMGKCQHLHSCSSVALIGSYRRN